MSRRARYCIVEGRLKPRHRREARCSEHAYAVNVKRAREYRSSAEMLSINRPIRE